MKLSFKLLFNFYKLKYEVIENAYNMDINPYSRCILLNIKKNNTLNQLIHILLKKWKKYVNFKNREIILKYLKYLITVFLFFFGIVNPLEYLFR